VVAVADTCARVGDELTKVFALLGKRWTGLILAGLMPGPAHYADLRRAVPGISERMLSSRLAELSAAGLVTREVVDGPPLGVRYQVTPSGAALRPAMEELAKWAQEHFATEPIGISPGLPVE
jgi:DNA-binding HxlR family transcriptional regulator